MSVKIALTGNPNSGKTTLFNSLTGSSQYVGNWPGVTVEKKEGRLKGNKDVTVIDLPGIYSLSPYTLEEVVTRDYLLNDSPDLIINIVDASNIERNLYLTTQLLETGLPILVVLNMMDIVYKEGTTIDVDKLSEFLQTPVVEISALKNEGTKVLTEKAILMAKDKPAYKHMNIYSKEISESLDEIKAFIPASIKPEQATFISVKIFERDEKVLTSFSFKDSVSKKIESIILKAEKSKDDDCESIITDERYTFVGKIVSKSVTKTNLGLSTSDKIDLIVTNKYLGLPVFAAIMFFIYYVSVTSVGTILTDFTNDTFVGSWVQQPLSSWLLSIGTADWLTGLVVDGIVGGVGAVLGFLPQMIILFFFLAILEDSGYMSRVAFLMDRIFRKFGMSGKAFIGLLIGTGCGVPGIMASRTIEQQRDRRMAIITTTFMPCTAKLPMIALIASAMFGGIWWVAPSAYFVGMGSVVVSGIMLKKTKPFMGEAAPFVIELPKYHMPTYSNILRSVWNRSYSFAKKAVTFITITSIFIWIAASLGFSNGSFGLVESMNDSILYYIGNSFAWVFSPLGFGNWQAAVSTLMGLAAKEQIVGVLGVLTSIGSADVAMEMTDSANVLGLSPVASLFTSSFAAYSYLIFNLLCAPCFAAMAAIKSEMNNSKWTAFAILYQCSFAYVISLIIYNVGMLVSENSFTAGTVVAFAFIIFLLYMLFRPMPKEYINKSTKKLAHGSANA